MTEQIIKGVKKLLEYAETAPPSERAEIIRELETLAARMKG